jgi:hypothetical protein
MELTLGKEFEVSLHFSVQSEVAYLSIFYENTSYDISVRSHTTRDPSFDKAYCLHTYKTWQCLV